MVSTDQRIINLERKVEAASNATKLNRDEDLRLGLEVELVEYITPLSSISAPTMKKYRNLWSPQVWLSYLKKHTTGHNDVSKPGEWWSRLSAEQQNYLLSEHGKASDKGTAKK